MTVGPFIETCVSGTFHWGWSNRLFRPGMEWSVVSVQEVNRAPMPHHDLPLAQGLRPEVLCSALFWGEHMDSEEKDKPSTTLPGKVQKIIKPIDPKLSETAEIAIEGAEELYREIRVENKLKDASGTDVALKEGAPVEVTLEAEEKDTIKKPE